MDLPEAAGGRLAEWTGPAGTRPGAGVGPGPVGDLELGAWRGTTRRPADMSRGGLAQSLLGGSRSRAGLNRLTADLSVVEVLLPLGLIRYTAVSVEETERGHRREKGVTCVFGVLLKAPLTRAQM